MITLDAFPAALGTLVARDVMTEDVEVVTPETSIPGLIDLLVSRQISGVPVTATNGQVLGVVSASDVLRHAAQRKRTVVGFAGTRVTDDADGFFRDEMVLACPAWGQLPYDEMDDAVVGDIMTCETYSVRPDATLPETARLLQHKGIHRALVMRGDRLLGIVTTTDIVAAVAASDS